MRCENGEVDYRDGQRDMRNLIKESDCLIPIYNDCGSMVIIMNE